MRKRFPVLLLLVGLLVWSGCGRMPEPEPADYMLYFMADNNTHHGPALVGQPWQPEAGVQPDPGMLLEALMQGPAQEGLLSPFPRGVTVRSWEWDPETAGNLKVLMSESYSGLTDISLTLADYAIVLTLAQVDGVESVEIQSSMYSANYRSHQLLLAEEAELVDSLAH